MSQYEGDIPDYPIQNELTSSIRKAAANIGDKELHICGVDKARD